MFWDEVKTCPVETSKLLSEFPFKRDKVRKSKLQVSFFKQKRNKNQYGGKFPRAIP